MSGVVVLCSVRYGVPVESEHDNVEEALTSAYWEIEDNRAAPKRIVAADDRRVLLEGAELEVALQRRGEAIEAAYEARERGGS